jgi:hemolysin III
LNVRSLVINDGASEAPIKPDQEWANALTHGIATVGSIVGGIALTLAASKINLVIAVACGVYMTATTATFLSSTLSHRFLKQPWLNTFRAWDQAMIYAMIAGTYTPLACGYATSWWRVAVLVGMWIAASIGIVKKLLRRHRINSMSPVGYIMLGWMPAAALFHVTPWDVGGMMLAGGVGYTAGVYFLMNDRRRRYNHAIWHVFVMASALVQYIGVWMVLGDLK